MQNHYTALIKNHTTIDSATYKNETKFYNVFYILTNLYAEDYSPNTTPYTFVISYAYISQTSDSSVLPSQSFISKTSIYYGSCIWQHSHLNRYTISFY